MNKSIYRFCGDLLRLHSYKGWYHPDGKGKGKRDHKPTPSLESDYPEHEKLQNIKYKSQAIGDFITWLGDVKAIRFAKWFTQKRHDWTTDKDVEVSELCPIGFSINNLLSEYFEIDQVKLEAEKRQMLDSMREANQNAS